MNRLRLILGEISQFNRGHIKFESTNSDLNHRCERKMQSLFAMHYKLFEVLSVMHGPLAEELKRLALSSLGKNETMDTVRSLLPPQHNYTGRDQQSLCEFWFHLFEKLDAEHQANDMSPLRSLYQFKNN